MAMTIINENVKLSVDKKRLILIMKKCLMIVLIL